MDGNATQLFNERLERVKKTISLEKADRVPFIPKLGNYMISNYGITHYDYMKDARSLIPGAVACCRELEPDMVWTPGTFCMDGCDILDINFVKYPGEKFGLAPDASFQVMDRTYLQDDEFDEFLQDPTHFLITKIMPRKYNNLKGLSKWYGREVYDMAIHGGMGAFDEDVMDAFKAYYQACKCFKERNLQMRSLSQAIEEAGYPIRGAGVILHPFDAYADSLRGLVQATIDIYEFPDQVHQVCDRLEAMNMDRSIAIAKARHDNLVYIPLHAAGDDFMSRDNYAEFYWPALKRMINKIIDAGLTPYIFCEGKYNTRFEFLKDVPKGKVVYLFEQVDIAKAKKELEGIATICGNFPSTLLAHGTPEQIKDETKRLIDICAPGGGFIMDASIVIDTAKEENMMAWKEATFEYGCY